MTTNNQTKKRGRAASACGGHRSIGRGTPAAPLSNTGRKSKANNPVVHTESREPLCGGELLREVTTVKHNWMEIHPLPDERTLPEVALIDWLAFTLKPAQGGDESGYRWICGELARCFSVDVKGIERQKTGASGYANRALFSGGHILWGGNSQRGTIHVSLSGEGCARIDDWMRIADWLETHGATLKRVDLAYDDFTCETISIETFRTWYQEGKFGSGGRQPEAQLVDDLGSGKGSTFYVGRRRNGKLFRGYEKGKQLGDPTSRWVRAECEWRNKGRVLPYDMLRRPGQYLAGAYPCLHFLNAVQSKVRTVVKAAKIVFDRALDNARQQVGKLVNLALSVFQGDYAEVVERLRRDGIPKRIEPYSYHIAAAPERLVDGFDTLALSTV